MHRLLVTLVLLSLAGLFHLASKWEIPVLDSASQRYFEQSITSSTLAYAVIRGVNAVVSVLKESHVAVSPAGVGLSIAAGQILDPLDDMTERLSDVVVLAIVSLGIQKMGFELANLLAFEGMALVCLTLVVLLWVPNGKWVQALFRVGLRTLALLLLMRFLLPASSYANDLVYQHVFSDKIQSSTIALRLVSSHYDQLGTMDGAGDSGLFAGVSNRIEKMQALWSRVVEQAEGLVVSLLRLTTLYLGVFLFQVLLIPLGGLWLLIAAIRYTDLSWLAQKLLPN